MTEEERSYSNRRVVEAATSDSWLLGRQDFEGKIFHHESLVT